LITAGRGAYSAGHVVPFCLVRPGHVPFVSFRRERDTHCQSRYLVPITSCFQRNPWKRISPGRSPLFSSRFLSILRSFVLVHRLTLPERASSVILSWCITYRAIECPDRDPGTRAPIRSARSIILSPRNAASLGNLIGRLGKRVRNPPTAK